MPVYRLVLMLLYLLLPLTVDAEEVELAETATGQVEAPAELSLYVPQPLGITDWSNEVLTSKAGYVHPFLAVTEYYTDNLFNTDSNKESELYTVISPGVWLALPASRQPFLRLNTLNTAPGGLDVSRLDMEYERRMQAYALYRADIREYGEHSEENRVDQRGEVLLRYNFRGGLSLQIDDIYEKNQDPYSTGAAQQRELDEFQSNLAHLQIDYAIGPRLQLRGDYSYYMLDYAEVRNAFRERDDNAFSLYLFYRLLPKTSTILLYEHIDVDYDWDILLDSKESHYYAGIEWDMTAKSRGRFMLGYGEKDFSSDNDSNEGELLGEIQLDHRFSPKTAAFLRATRKTNESDIDGVAYIVTHRYQLGLRHRMTARLRGSCDFFYLRDSYQGTITIDNLQGDRVDDYYGAGLAVAYAPLRWLNLAIGYRYRDRSSNFTQYDYQSNTVYLTIAAAL